MTKTVRSKQPAILLGAAWLALVMGCSPAENAAPPKPPPLAPSATPASEPPPPPPKESLRPTPPPGSMPAPAVAAPKPDDDWPSDGAAPKVKIIRLKPPDPSKVP